tara:strand:+ start:2990 stop:3343 length:354 start_codon:yes stop_codon:yes gene_type:complete
MELKSLYTRAFELDDDFIVALEDVPPSLSLTVALYIEEYLPVLPPDELCTHILGGLVYHFDEPVPFVIEILKPDEYLMVLTDIQFIDMDEYLDLINLKLNLEPDDRFSYPRLISRSK